jgi:hypothetical protein
VDTDHLCHDRVLLIWSRWMQVHSGQEQKQKPIAKLKIARGKVELCS